MEILPSKWHVVTAQMSGGIEVLSEVGEGNTEGLGQLAVTWRFWPQ